jgi:nucleoside-diphosphate-sugar epimerase
VNWNRSRVLVTGGASFIGSALVDELVERGARVRVVLSIDLIQRSVLLDLGADALEPAG